MLVNQTRYLIKAKYPRFFNLLRSWRHWARNNKYGHFLSLQKVVTACTGPLYNRNGYEIELDITYSCNLKCFGCNRICGLAPSDDSLNLAQIRQFIRESTARDTPWKTINVMGGEPTMHPQFLSIIEELLNFKSMHSPNVNIVVCSNGCGKKVNDMLARLGPDVSVRNSAKNSNVQVFQPFNLAPKDSLWYRNADYSCGCWITRDCGMCLTPFGYYHCAPAGAIDRVFGFNLGKKALPSLANPMRDEMAVLCGYCGHFRFDSPRKLDQDLISRSWRRALDKYHIAKPRMTLYR
jgi:hypothetical protein